jgi:hypothetical protein
MEQTSAVWARENHGLRNRTAASLFGIRQIVGACFALLVLSGCGATYAEREVNYKPTDVIRASDEIAENELLGVRINTFTLGNLPESSGASLGISKDVRKAEGYYIAVKLRNTMQGSGHWGPVRVVPADNTGGEIIVKGEILESDGEVLKLKVSVNDAAGSEWYTKEYGGVVNQEIYDQASQVGIDAFQYLYNQIANDIALHRQTLGKDQIVSISQVSELKFAESFAPEIFSDYLQKKELGGTPPNQKYEYTISRLPSQNDPAYQRVKRIRGREHLLIDTLDQQYDGLAKRVTDAYSQWRVARLTEMNAIREREKIRDKKVGQSVAIGVLGAIIGGVLASKGGGRGGAVVGGVIAGTAINAALQQAIKASSDAEADTQIRKQALEELGQSLGAEVKPVVLEVEGETVELTGTVEAKFQQWRDVMKELHEREVGSIKNIPKTSDTKAGAAG